MTESILMDPDDPSWDFVGMIRVHPDHDPLDELALRVIAVAGSSPHHVRLTGSDRAVAENGGPWWDDTTLRTWPRQSLVEFAALLPSPQLV